MFDKNEIIEMAKQAGLLDMDYEIGQWEIHEFTNFAKLVAAKERDRMCKQCTWSNYENATCNEANQ